MNLKIHPLQIYSRSIRLNPFGHYQCQICVYRYKQYWYQCIGKNRDHQHSSKAWNLVPFEVSDRDGLIFRSADFISIPAGTSQKPAVVEVEVTADAYDLAGVGIGERGNLSKDIELSLPGLKLGSQKLISAKT